MIKYTLVLLFAITLTFSCKDAAKNTSSETNSSGTSEAWQKAQEIEKDIVVPTFAQAQFNIADYGVNPNTKENQVEGFNAAIKACNEAGGGKVIVPEGTYFTGPIHLLDNVNLHLEAGSTIKFSTNPEDFPIVHTSFEGTELMNYSPLVYAFGKKNVAVTGEGVLDGQADATNWWPWKGSKPYGWSEGMPSQLDTLNRDRLIDLAERRVPVSERIFGPGYYMRPTFVEFFECKNVLIQGIKIINAPFWVVHPIKSTNITVDGITVESHGPNNDGCDPEYCKNVMIKNCYFNTGDDCIAIKSGRNEDGRRVGIKSERIIVRDCKMIDGHGGVVMGSEISAGVSDVYVENCSMDSPNLDRAIRIKTNSKRGGVVENVYVRNVQVGQVKEAVLKVNMFYGTYSNQEGEYIPTVRNIMLENVTVKNGGYYAILAKGYESSPIENITFKNVTIEKVDEAFSLENVKGLKLIDTYINGSLAQSPAAE